MPGYGPENTPLKRIDFKAIRRSLLKVFNLEKGIGYTLVNLAIRPGKTINTYLFENRTKLVKPVGFLFFTVTIATFLTVNFIDLGAMLGGDNSVNNAIITNNSTLMDQVSEKFGQFYNVLSLLAVPMLALGSYAVYHRQRYHYAEHLVISAYLTAFITACYIFFFPFFMVSYMFATVVYLIVFIGYCTFAFGQIFNEISMKGLLKGMVAQLIYFSLFMFLGMILSFFLGIYLAFKMKGDI